MKKQILMVNLFIISCTLIAASAVSAAQARGGGRGGFGEDGAACATFRDAGTDEIASDGLTPYSSNADVPDGAYCNGFDGQVSVPKRFRIDLKKFNSNERFISVVNVGGVSFDGNVIFQSQLQYNIDDTGPTPVPTSARTLELDFPSMGLGDIEFVSMSVDFKVASNVGYRINYGKEGDMRLPCPGGSNGQPVRVRCNDSDSGRCIDWTVTGGMACLLDLKTEEFVLDVQADFSLDVIVSPLP